MNDRAAPAVATHVPETDAPSSNAGTGPGADTIQPSTANRTLRERLARIWPYFSDCRRGFVLAVADALVGAATEPAIPAPTRCCATLPR